MQFGEWLETFLLLAFCRDRKRCSSPGEHCFNAKVHIVHTKILKENLFPVILDNSHVFGFICL